MYLIDKSLIANVINKNIDNVHHLLNQGANPNFKDKSGKSALFYTLQQPNIVQLLLEYGADVNLQDSNGITALKRAIEGKRISVIATMLYN